MERKTGIFSGEEVVGKTCFGPRQGGQSRRVPGYGYEMAECNFDDAQLTSGFADESQTPEWMRPYLVSALRAGVISGVNSDDGLVFRPNTALTQAEAVL